MSNTQDARLSAGMYAPGQAPRLSRDDIMGTIMKFEYAVFEQLTICVLTLKNGTKLTGESACVYPENFDAELGMKLAREKAIEKIWAREGYLLAQLRYENELRYSGN